MIDIIAMPRNVRDAALRMACLPMLRVYAMNLTVLIGFEKISLCLCVHKWSVGLVRACHLGSSRTPAVTGFEALVYFAMAGAPQAERLSRWRRDIPAKPDIDWRQQDRVGFLLGQTRSWNYARLHATPRGWGSVLPNHQYRWRDAPWCYRSLLYLDEALGPDWWASRFFAWLEEKQFLKAIRTNGKLFREFRNIPCCLPRAQRPFHSSWDAAAAPSLVLLEMSFQLHEDTVDVVKKMWRPKTHKGVRLFAVKTDRRSSGYRLADVLFTWWDGAEPLKNLQYFELRMGHGEANEHGTLLGMTRMLTTLAQVNQVPQLQELILQPNNKMNQICSDSHTPCACHDASHYTFHLIW